MKGFASLRLFAFNRRNPVRALAVSPFAVYRELPKQISQSPPVGLKVAKFRISTSGALEHRRRH